MDRTTEVQVGKTEGMAEKITEEVQTDEVEDIAEHVQAEDVVNMSGLSDLLHSCLTKCQTKHWSVDILKKHRTH